MALPSYTPGYTRRRPGGGGASSADSMVEMELNAARALVHMAGIAVGNFNHHSVELESSEEEGASGREGGGSRKRSESESPVRARDGSFCQPLACLASNHHEEKRGKEDKVEESVHSLQNVHRKSEIVKSSCDGRAKQNLTEAEKEAKRLRRVMANRESARQTILRRQAIRDELARRVADLSVENVKMKMTKIERCQPADCQEKESVMKEYSSLKDTNKKLKEQMAKIAMDEAERSADIAATKVQYSSISSSDMPSWLVYSKPALLPSICSSLPFNFYELSNPSNGSSWPFNFYELSNPSNGNVSGVPLSMQSFARHYHFLREIPGSYEEYFHVYGNQDVPYPGIQCGPRQPYGEEEHRGKASLHTVNGGKCSLLVAFGTGENATNSTAMRVPERICNAKQVLESHPQIMSSTTSPCLSLNSSLREKGKMVLNGCIKASPMKLMNAAAEARKKRKELTKFKHILARQDVCVDNSKHACTHRK